MSESLASPSAVPAESAEAVVRASIPAMLAGPITAVVTAAACLAIGLGLESADPRTLTYAVLASAVPCLLTPAILLVVGSASLSMFSLAAMAASGARLLASAAAAMASLRLLDVDQTPFVVTFLTVVFAALVAEKLAIVATLRPHWNDTQRRSPSQLAGEPATPAANVPHHPGDKS
ncbi:MAG: hypothetical protein AAF747_02540 [Planctomycetota bacterium]